MIQHPGAKRKRIAIICRTGYNGTTMFRTKTLIKRWLSLAALACLVALAPVMSVRAVCDPNAQTCSSNYQVTESFFGAGGSQNDTCSSTYCAKQSVGALGVGHTGSFNSYQGGVLGDTAPAAYWRMGELAGTSMYDTTGNGHSGTYSGGFTLGATGIPAISDDSAVSFNGTSGLSTVAYNSALDYSSSATQTIELWYKGTQTSSTNTKSAVPGLITANTDGSNQKFVVGLLASGAVSVGYGTAYAGVNGSAVVNDNAWHQIICTIDYSGGSADIVLYVDGTVDASGTVSMDGGTGTPSITIAQNPQASGGDAYTTGTIDEVAIYGKVLSPQQVTSHYKAGTTGIGYQAQGGFNTDRWPSLEFIVNTPSVNVGVLDAAETHVGSAEFQVKSYLAQGYQVRTEAVGPSISNHTLASPGSPTASTVGTEQFGMNVVANSCPGTAPGSGDGSCTGTLGANPSQDPDASFSYGVAAPGYNTPDLYKYADGDTIALSNSSSGLTVFTISYIFNIIGTTPAGIYTMNQNLVTTSTF